MLSLFAVEEGLAITGAVGGALAIIKFIWDIITENRKQSREYTDKERDAKKKERVDAMAELKNLYDMLKKDYEQTKLLNETRMGKVETSLDESEKHRHKCEKRQERMAAHIRYIEEAMRRSKMEFMPWCEVDDESKEHEILTSQGADHAAG